MSEKRPISAASEFSQEEIKPLIERFNEPEDNYQLLRGDMQGFLNRENKRDTDGVLQMYVNFTDKLIGVADGSIKERDLVDQTDIEKSKQAPDEIIFLDKSARPVAWFMDGLWDQFAKPGAKKPHYDFLNIDRIDWFVSLGYSRQVAEQLGPSDFDINKVPREDISRIRALFVEGQITEDNWQEEVWKLPTSLDGKVVLVVDEVKNQGGTLAIATQIIKKAVPEATVTGQYFWESKRTQVGDSQQMDSAPVWYDKVDPMGRGVGNISQTYYDILYEISPSQDHLKSKIGWKVLSAPHHDHETFEFEEDLKAEKLKQDIAHLSYAVASGKIQRRPSLYRDSNDFIGILDSQNLSIEQSRQWYENSQKIKNQNGQ